MTDDGHRDATDSELFDPGLQPERTALAWRRTVLALAVGSLVSLRILPPVLGGWSFAIGLAGLVVSGVGWILAGARARRTQRALLDSGHDLPGSGLLLMLALLVSVTAAFGLTYVVLASR